MSTPSMVEEPVESEWEDRTERSGVDERNSDSPAVEHPRLGVRIRNELWRPGYLALATLIVVLLALQVWILF